MGCFNCDETEWVCSAHPDRPSTGKYACECRAPPQRRPLCGAHQRMNDPQHREALSLLERPLKELGLSNPSDAQTLVRPLA